jgi:hypothetical protein
VAEAEAIGPTSAVGLIGPGCLPTQLSLLRLDAPFSGLKAVFVNCSTCVGRTCRSIRCADLKALEDPG